MANRRGAPKGNRNALKHGFYSKALDRADRGLIVEVSGCQGLDQEIDILRIKIHRLLERDPDNLELQATALTTLARLVKTRYETSAEQRNSLKEAALNVLTDAAVNLGLKMVPGLPR